MEKVKNLKEGSKVNVKGFVYFVIDVFKDKVTISKSELGTAVFSLSVFSPNYDDLFNRVELV